jgi:hypothetical protein
LANKEEEIGVFSLAITANLKDLVVSASTLRYLSSMAGRSKKLGLKLFRWYQALLFQT